jgi:predicted DNA-binding WGR domain protein
MSHFTTVETKIHDLVILKKVIEAMGYKIKEGVRQVRGYRGQLADAEMVIDTKASVDIGIVKTEKGYSFIADWDEVETRAGIEQKEFTSQVMKKYSYEKVMSEIKKKGYVVATEKTDQHQHIHITIRKWS